MLNFIYKDDFLPSFQYLVDEKSFKYDVNQRVLEGKFEFLSSPYLSNSDQILNMEDDIFIMTQSLFVLFALYYKHEYNFNYQYFTDHLLGNIVVKNVNYTFNQLVLKNKDKNLFKHQLINLKIDSKNRLWFNSYLSIAESKHICEIVGCVMTEEVHRI